MRNTPVDVLYMYMILEKIDNTDMQTLKTKQLLQVSLAL